MRRIGVGGIVLLLVFGTQAPAQEAVAKSKIVSVGLFKNGLVIVKREVQIPAEGVYRLDALPEPVHGSFWVESSGKVDVALKMRDVEISAHSEGGVNIQRDLAGKKVTLTFRNDKIAPVTGVMLKAGTPTRIEGVAALPVERSDGLWILKTEKGRLYFNPTDVMLIQAEDGDDKVIHRKPVLVLTVEKEKKKPSVYVSYLTNGLAWAPSYRVDLSDPKSLEIEMATVVRNEMGDIDDAEVKLISGFPSVEFANVTSPLSSHTSWSRFFSEVSGRHHRREEDGLLQQRIFSNSALTNFDTIVRPKIDLGATPSGEGVDLHFESIGKRTLLRDEAISLTMGKEKANYERVIEWTVGTSTIARRYGGSSMQRPDEMWDVVVFKNPFKFPMTTAPAMVVDGGKFNGQRTSYWTNVGEEAWLKITRSLSVRTQSREQEDSKPNERVVVDDKNYTKIHLKGELIVNNHRKQTVKMFIRHSIRGAISEIEGAPKVITREETLEEVNRIHDAVWTVTLAPGEEKRLTYKNSVLVYR